MACKKKPLTTKSKKTAFTTRSKHIQLHQDMEEDEEQEETKEESVEQEEQENNNVDDSNVEEEAVEEEAAVTSQASKKKSTKRTKPCGLGYTQEETETLLSCIHKVITIGPQDWENILRKHNKHFCKTDCYVTPVKHKYNKLQSACIPTGDPNCPPLVHQAKHIHQDIEEKMDAQEELNKEELGFPLSDVEDNIAVTSPTPAAAAAAVATPTVPEAHNSPAFFHCAKRAKIEPQGISSKVDGLLSVGN